MPNPYNSSIVYAIQTTVLPITIIYVGSTINLKSRKCQHKSTTHNNNDRGYNKNIYRRIREIGWENITFSILEIYNCDNKKELHVKEGYYQRLYSDTLCGQHIMTHTRVMTTAENQIRLYNINQEYRISYQKKYRDTNRATSQCGCGSTFLTYNLCRHIKSKKHIAFLALGSDDGDVVVAESDVAEVLHNIRTPADFQLIWRKNNQEKYNAYQKTYRENNQETVIAYRKQHYQDNKDYYKSRSKISRDKIMENKEIYQCECGSTMLKYNLRHHIKTKKHIKFMASVDVVVESDVAVAVDSVIL